MRRAVTLAILAGCAYQPSSFHRFNARFPGQRTTIGCLDVSVNQTAERSGISEIEYDFGNRCDHATPVDLTAIHVWGHTVDGAQIAMRPIDPRHVLRPLAIDGRLVGREQIDYDAGQVDLASVCVDIAPIAHAAAPPQWLCFGTTELAVAP